MKELKDMKRVLLKLSGEALAGDKKTGFDDNQVIVKINGNDTPFTFEFKEVKQNL